MPSSKQRKRGGRAGSSSRSRPTLYDAAKLEARLARLPEGFRELFRDTYIGARKRCVKAPAGSSPAGLPELIDRLCGEWAARARPACDEGCSWCCQQDVLMAPFEFDAVRAAIEAGGLAETVRRNLEAADSGPSIEVEGRKLPISPCPFLDNDRCMIYHARPISCRTQFSMDADRCRLACEAARGGDANAAYQRAADPAIVGMAVREAVQPTRRVFLRDELRAYLAGAATPASRS